MQYFIELLKIILPAGLVIYGMYLVVVSFLSKEREAKLIALKTRNSDVILPLRLQAGERLCLLLERLTPNNLVRRVNNQPYSARELHGLLLSEIREEFNHNMAQQIYFSDDTWESVKTAVEEVVTLVNRSMQEVNPDEKGVELAKRVFQHSLEQKNDGISFALKQVKSEIRVYF